MNVTKRDGRVVEFDTHKVYAAIVKAFNSVYANNLTTDMMGFANVVAMDIAKRNADMAVEEIQDAVVKKLMASKYKEVATAYVEYRHLHQMARSQYAELMDAVAEKLQAKDVKNQNANVDEHSFGGRIGEASSVVNRRYALEYLVSPMAKTNHENNEVYIHDLDAYAVGSHNCLSIPFDQLLANGFNTRQTDVRPAQSINTAFQLVAVIFQLQSLQQFGGVSATHLDWTMVPYVRKSFYKHYRDGIKYLLGQPDCILDAFDARFAKSDDFNGIEEIPINNRHFYHSHDDGYGDDQRVYQYALDMTTKECYQAVEGMYHNLNCIRAA